MPKSLLKLFNHSNKLNISILTQQNQIIRKIMFNRHLYEKIYKQFNKKTNHQKNDNQYFQKKKLNDQKLSEKYKSKVRDFLIQITAKPIELGQYQPPIVKVERDFDSVNILGSPKMFINGFKTNKDRIKDAFESNQIIDNTPTKNPALNHNFRIKNSDKQIQPFMRFSGKQDALQRNFSLSTIKFNKSLNSTKFTLIKSKSLSKTKLPTLAKLNPQKKTYFKAVQEIGNRIDLNSDRQSDKQILRLRNRLQTIYKGKEVEIEQAAFDALQKCHLLKKRARSLHFLQGIKTGQS